MISRLILVMMVSIFCLHVNAGTSVGPMGKKESDNLGYHDAGYVPYKSDVAFGGNLVGHGNSHGTFSSVEISDVQWTGTSVPSDKLTNIDTMSDRVGTLGSGDGSVSIGDSEAYQIVYSKRNPGFIAIGRSLYDHDRAQAQAQYWAQKKCGSKKAQRVSGWKLSYDVEYHDDAGCFDEPRYCPPTVIPQFSAEARFVCK